MLPPLSEDTFNYEDGNGNASNHSANPKSDPSYRRFLVTA
jgi:hypothetical protein